MKIYDESGDCVFPEDFQMKYLRHEYVSAEHQNSFLWPRMANTPVFLRRYQEFDELAIYMYMKDGGLRQASGLAEKMRHCFISDVDMPFLREVEFECYLRNVESMKKNRRKYEVVYRFSAIAWGLPAKAENTSVFYVDGSRETPATITLQNTTGAEIASAGIGIGDYRIDSLQAGEIITVDGRDKLVTSTTRDAVFSAMSFVRFPSLTPGVAEWEIHQPTGVSIVVAWKPRW